MKDATGELSMTAVAVVAIAAIALLFQQIVWPAIKANIERNTHCSNAFNCGTAGSNGMVTCYYLPDSGNAAVTISCPNSTNG